MVMRMVTITAAVLGLAACGGGGGSGGGGGGLTPGQIDGAIDGLPVSSPALLPTTGRAMYDGYMRARLPTGPEGERRAYLADLRMEVNFGAGFDQIRGRASGFEAGDGVPMDGALAITAGRIYPDTDPAVAYSFDAALGGTLSDARASYGIDATIEGEFLGLGQTAARGLVYGDITGPRGQDIFDGTFATTRIPD